MTVSEEDDHLMNSLHRSNRGWYAGFRPIVMVLILSTVGLCRLTAADEPASPALTAAQLDQIYLAAAKLEVHSL